MVPLRRILVATDFSQDAERAVERAAQLAAQHGAELHVLHVLQPLDLFPTLILGPDGLGGHDEAARAAEHARLGEQAVRLSERLGVPVHADTRIGTVHGEIADQAKSVGADLVVVGARGENTLLDLLMGATASRLLRLLDRPALIVRKPAAAPYRKVLAAVDLSPGSDEVVRHARALSGDSAIEVLHVLGSEVEHRLRRAKLAQADIGIWLERQRGEAIRQLDALLARLEPGVGMGRSVRQGLASAVICQHAAETGADLIVLGRHGPRGALHPWMLGGVSKDVAFATRCDVLLIGLPGS